MLPMPLWTFRFFWQSLFLWGVHSKMIFFKELYSQKPYMTNHLYQSLDYVVYKDSIMHPPDADYVLIGTNNSIVKLDINNMNILQRLEVSKEIFPSPCFRDKYADEYPCHIFGYWTKIIPSTTDSGNHQLFICHNNGIATYHNIKNFDQIITERSICPTLSTVSLLSLDKHFYVGNLERSPKIIRFNPEYPKEFSYRKKERLHTSIDSSWIQQNDYLQFVFTFENGNYVYFLIREIAEEDRSYCQSKEVKSRIVRLFKDDNGGSSYVLKNTWISFVKATVICPDRSRNLKDSSLNYVENAYFDAERQILYATFSAGPSASPTTAICLYSITDIETALEGLYFDVQNPRNPVPKAATTCENNQRDCISRTARYQLKFSPVLPNMKRNLIFQNGEVWTHIQVLTIDRSSRQYDIVFLATSNGQIKKYFRKLTESFLCYSETLALLPDNKDSPPTIRDMRLVNSKLTTQPFLLVTVDTGVYKIGIEHCTIHSLEKSCVDPFCYWEEATNLCTSIFQIAVYKLRQLPELKYCSNGSELFDPLMEQWSAWESCGNPDNACQCRIRNCKPGACVNTGQLVENSEIEVRNCSDHHQWSSWSPWSECSSKCSLGNSTRERWCFQNGNCLGSRVETKLCFTNNQCKSPELTLQWSPWSECSSKCGEGVITRTKPCQDIHMQDGIPNNMCSLIEYQPCSNTICEEIVKMSPVGRLSTDFGDEYYLASCGGQILDNANEITISIDHETMGGTKPSNIAWDCWSEWTKCHNHCSDTTDNVNRKSRNRVCKVKNEHVAKELCTGMMREESDCNDNLCLRLDASLEEKGFQLIYVVLVGVASFTISCLFVVAGVCIYFAKQKTITKHTKPAWQVHTLPRKSFVRASYSPSQQSPAHTPIEFPWSPSEGYTSLPRFGRKTTTSLVHMPIPHIQQLPINNNV